jgi:hypothetical protein
MLHVDFEALAKSPAQRLRSAGASQLLAHVQFDRSFNLEFHIKPYKKPK